jgi:hypothetical protein
MLQQAWILDILTTYETQDNYNTRQGTLHDMHNIRLNNTRPDKIKWKKGMAHVKVGAMGNSIKLASILSPAVIARRTQNIAMWTISGEKQNNLLPQCCSNSSYNHCCHPGLFPCTSLPSYSLGSINPYLSIQKYSRFWKENINWNNNTSTTGLPETTNRCLCRGYHS